MRKRNKIVSTWFFTFRVPFGAAYVCPLPFPPCFSSPAPACHATHTAANSAGVYDTAQHGTVRNLIKCEFFFFFLLLFLPGPPSLLPFPYFVRRATCNAMWFCLSLIAFVRDCLPSRLGIHSHGDLMVASIYPRPFFKNYCRLLLSNLSRRVYFLL